MRLHRYTIPIAGLALALAACGGDGGEGDDAAAPEVATFTGGEATFVGTGDIAWESESVEAEIVDGQLDVTIVCEGALPHNLLIEGVMDETEIVACEGEDQATATVDLEPGTYDFWCNIPGHREAGMEGVLTVS